MEDFSKNVKMFDSVTNEICELTQKIKPLNSTLKQLKIRKSEIQGNICEYMCNNNIDTCNMRAGGTLVYKETKSYKTLSSNDIKENIMNYFHDHPDLYGPGGVKSTEFASHFIQYVFSNNREINVKTSINKLNPI